MRVRIRHQSRYVYERPTSLGAHTVRLRPAGHTRAAVLSYNLAVNPEVGTGRALTAPALHWQHDAWGNRLARVTFPETARYDAIDFTVDLALEIRPTNPFDFFVDERCRQLPFVYPDGTGDELAPFLAKAPVGPRLRAFIEALPARGYVTDYLVALNRKVAKEIRYLIRTEPGVQTAEQTLEKGAGSCRDSALLLCEALRAQGLAARFVSGYLVQLADEGIVPGEPKGVGQDVVDLHAWCEVYVPGAGWFGLDGTSGLLTGEGHLPLAATVLPSLAAPISGTTTEPAKSVSFELTVDRLGHEPRPRRPYTEEAWTALRAAGAATDAALEAEGLKLTMGGEPTWTSREQPHAREWMTEALGPSKWEQGLRLTQELHQRLGPGLVALQRMGKQYPGESLPRWALELFWRKDGLPIWRESQLLELSAAPRKPLLDPAVEALAFAQALAARLRVQAKPVPAYEDPWLAVTQELNLPEDVDPLKATLEGPEARRTLARSLGQGLRNPVGYALPLMREESGWVTSDWSFKRGHLFLLPGDSPIGLRLPLDRLVGTPRPLWIADTSDVKAPLSFNHSTPPSQEVLPESEGGTVRTALCVEAREGILRVFLPPLPRAEDFLELVAAIEDIAAQRGRAVLLEGYPPPADPRLVSCAVTPDPGVLEVNVPPTDSFAEYVRTLELASDAANHAGLTTEKYQLDGREVGSGGGHHLTLGGATATQSPFLQRPELLAGLLRYVQNHPSLSFLFSGQFVGPTSQAPRIDEARHDALYELELALARAEEAGRSPQPWLTDRLFRNLLADVSGNTHRTEICIDKLYDPASPTGRLGLVELRAFEMPPHERMAAAQMLLVRTLVARLARSPYRTPLVRWGSQLHDRFMLPHFLWADFTDVLADLSAAKLPLRSDWYRPFLEWRLPVFGRVTFENVELELRAAIEPWPVLAEQQSTTGTSRYVDSSLERLQVRVDGLTPERHRVLVNGVELPLRSTGRAAEQVLGVRYRAWQPPNALHPENKVHHPLRFDVVDTWGKRSLGSCTHHVWHPEGRAFDKPPLTALEAAARRAQRFTTEGHAPWPVVPKRVELHPEQPFTLDLRRV